MTPVVWVGLLIAGLFVIQLIQNSFGLQINNEFLELRKRQENEAPSLTKCREELQRQFHVVSLRDEAILRLRQELEELKSKKTRKRRRR